MTLVWSVLIAFLLVVLLYQLVHRLLIKRATVMMQHQAQQATDQVVRDGLATKLPAAQLPQGSTIVADVWGKGVLVFEYELDLAKLDQVTRDWLTADHLGPQLDQAAHAAGVVPVAGAARAFIITDWWTYEDRLHIDVADLINEATREYVADLKKLD